MRTPDRRGVSEAISFVLIFALIIGTVGAVYAVGFGGLQEVRDAERINNAERAFDVLANNVDDLTQHGAPSRATEIQLAEASLGPGSPTYINVSGTDATSPDFTSRNTTLEAVVYSADDAQLRYVGGAIIRSQPGGATMLREPNFILSRQHVVVPLVQFDVESRTVGGSQTVQIRSESSVRRNLISETDTYDTVTVNVTSPTNEVWHRYLESQGMNCRYVDPGAGPTRVSCTLTDVERIHVSWHLIQFFFE